MTLKHSKAPEPSTVAAIINAGAPRVNAATARTKSAPPHHSGLETELKLNVSKEHLARLKRHPLLRSWRFKEKHELVSIYLDTKGHILGRQGLSFRLRRKGGQIFQTTKGAYHGILDRSEHETLFHGAEGDRSGLVEEFIGRLEDRKFPAALVPVFKTRIERETYEVGGVEVCLDKGEIIAGRRSSPIAEIELELKSGDRKQLFALARQISAIVPAEVSVKSKSERGYDLVEGIKARAIMARDPLLLPSCGATEALLAICNECLHQLISNRPGVQAHMAEALHQSRVALRRFEAAVKCFAGVKGQDTAAKVAAELKWIGGELASARELDVFTADVLVPLRTKHNSSVEGVYRACIRQRETAYVKANAALTSQRFRTFLIDVAEWIEIGSQSQTAGSQLEREPLVKDLVSKTLSKIWGKMKPGRRIDELDLRRLHKLRLRAKRMRYTIEFAKSLYDAHPRRIDRALEQLGKLQSALGQLNDIASGKAILDRITTQSKPDTKRRKSLGMSGLASRMFEMRQARNPDN
jgi:inorganic triphosphatase YgiF